MGDMSAFAWAAGMREGLNPPKDSMPAFLEDGSICGSLPKRRSSLLTCLGICLAWHAYCAYPAHTQKAESSGVRIL